MSVFMKIKKTQNSGVRQKPKMVKAFLDFLKHKQILPKYENPRTETELAIVLLRHSQHGSEQMRSLREYMARELLKDNLPDVGHNFFGMADDLWEKVLLGKGKSRKKRSDCC